MILYFFICLVSILAGCGILSVIGVVVDRRHTLFIAPVITLSSVTILMGVFVASGFSISTITPLLYALCIAAAIMGLLRYGKVLLASWRSLLILTSLPLLILLPFITEGLENYSGGPSWDGWSYVAMAESLQRYPLGAEGWYPVHVQYSAHLGKNIRVVSSAFLAFLAPLSGEHDDAQEVSGHYPGWLFFVYASACLFFGKAAGLSQLTGWIFVCLTTLTGWNLKILYANNLDNALALCFLPSLLGIIALSHTSRRYGAVVGVMLAAALYAYPEMWPFIAIGLFAVIVQLFIATRHQPEAFGRMMIALITTLCVCILPVVSQTVSFFSRQVGAAFPSIGVRPGEGFFPVLSVPSFAFQGYWGLSQDFQLGIDNYNAYAVTLASLLTVCALFGMSLLVWRRQWSLPLFVAAMTSAYLVALLYFHYNYAAYKLLVIAWFAIAFVVTVGGGWIWKSIAQKQARWVQYVSAGAGVALMTGIGGSFFIQERILYRSLPHKSLREYKKLSSVKNLAGGSAVAVVVSEQFANMWGVYFLRDLKLQISEYHGYMAGAHLAHLMARIAPVDTSEIRYAVTDNEASLDSERLLAKEGPYYIWDCRRRPWLLEAGVRNDNGVEYNQDGRFFWIGKGDTELTLLSTFDTPALLKADFTLGPSLPGKAMQRLLVAGSNFREERSIGTGTHSFVVPVQTGLNRVILRALETPTVIFPKDSRPLMIGVARVSVLALPTGPSVNIREITNPNGLEKVFSKEEPFFWVEGRRDTVVSVDAGAPGIARLTATLMPGPSLVDKSLARLAIVQPSGEVTQRDLPWGAARIDVPVQMGLNKIVIRAVGPSIPGKGDPRSMMVGFRDLRASYMSAKAPALKAVAAAGAR